MLKGMETWEQWILYYMIGGRGIGKTDLFLRAACLLWHCYRCKTYWLRNKQVEYQKGIGSFLADAYRHGWAPDEWEARQDGVYESDNREAERIIEFGSISTFSNRRGGARPDTLMIVFDEFMPEDERYPRDCAKGLGSLAMTVLRGRSGARIFCLSNWTRVKNPYFARMRIYPKAGCAVTVYPEIGTAIERCTGYNQCVREDSPFARMMGALGVGQYVDELEDPLAGLIAKPPKGAKPYPFLIYSHGAYVREWSSHGRVYYTEWKGQLPKDAVIYASNPDEAGPGVLVMPNFIVKHIKDNRDMDGARFSDPNVMFIVLDILYSYER